jgi:hypothetical protein
MGLSAGAIYISEPGVAYTVATRVGLLDAGSAAVEHTAQGFDMKDGVRLGVAEGQWSLILASPDALLPLMDEMSRLLTEESKGRRILLWCAQSASGGAMFEVHEDGALKRRWVEAEGQVFEDVGEPVPEEAGLVDRQNHEGGPLHSEWTLLELAAKITGIAVDQHFEMNGPVYAAAP